ncbi:FmdB family zinc ribbon protein [Isoptericola sp. NPDC057191]|uniref:FmdB family zinc ribbon protein n=1 Tax=Isoptericola sp. NPDC057191 TaxID=3346041 RepID=UPI00363C5D04
MPTYAYRCADCGHAFDVHQAFTDDSLTVCPECGGSLRKQYGSVGVTFKGSGFYRTDSRSGSGKSSSASSTSTSATKDSSSSSTSSSSSSSGASSSSSSASKAATS